MRMLRVWWPQLVLVALSLPIAFVWTVVFDSEAFSSELAKMDTSVNWDVGVFA